MKRLFFIIIIVFGCMHVFAQNSNNAITKLYFRSGMGVASKQGYGAALTAQSVFKKDWTASFSYHFTHANAINIPGDYSAGEFTVFGTGFNGSKPSVELNTFSLTGGKLFEAGRNCWFNAEAGVSIVNGEVLKFTRQQVTNTTLWIFSDRSSNYKIETSKKTVVGALVKADFTWAFSPFMGAGAGVYANLNSIQSPVGFHLTMMFGWMNIPKKKTK